MQREQHMNRVGMEGKLIGTSAACFLYWIRQYQH